MPDGEDQHRIAFALVAVQSEVSGTPSGDDELAQSVLHWATDERMVLQHPDCFLDEFRGGERRRRFRPDQELDQPLEIVERVAGVAQARQDLAFGLAARLPWARARMYAWTSAASYALPERSASVREPTA